MAEGGPPSLMFEWATERPNFVDYNPKYDCVICHQVMLDPVQTECGHRMCRMCCNEYFVQQGGKAKVPCPAPEETCGSISETNIVPDFPTKKEILNLSVHCTNQKRGCPEIKSWISLKEHLKVCKFKVIDCDNKELGCKSKLTAAHKKDHLQKECRFREVDCKYCFIKVPVHEMSKHVNEICKGVDGDTPMRCQYCHSTIIRRDRQAHYDTCSKQPKKCDISNCTFIGTSEELGEHSGVYQDQHVSLLNTVAEDLSQRLDRLDTMNIDGIRLENGRLKETVKQQHKTIANQEQKIMELQAKLTDVVGKLDNVIRRHESMEKTQNEHKVKIEQLTSGVGLPEDVRQQIIKYDRMVGQHHEQISVLETKFQIIERTSYDGTLVWKIESYASRKAAAVAGETVSIYSLPFYTSRYGYKMCARVYLNGDGLGKGTHMSLFFVLMKGENDALLSWPFRQKVVFAILDQETGRRNHTDSFRPDPTSTSFRRPVEEMNVATGCPLFLSHSTIESKPYLRDDAIFLRITVDPT